MREGVVQGNFQRGYAERTFRNLLHRLENYTLRKTGYPYLEFSKAEH